MDIGFDETSHTYSLNGDIASISVTELLSKHGLAPDYSGVSDAVLEDSSNRGKKAHRDLESCLNEKDYEATTKQGKNFAKWMYENGDSGVGEQMLGVDYQGVLICGTADVVGIMKDKSLFVGDHKTTANLNKEYVSWQCSIYDYMLRHNSGHRINGKRICWKGAEHLFCFHYARDGELKVVELERVEDVEIERLFQCEVNGEMYKRPVLCVAEDLQLKVEQAELMFKQAEADYKLAEKTRDEYRERLTQLFKEQGIYSWESLDKKVKVTYVAGGMSRKTDTKMLKEQFPNVWKNCQREYERKPYVRVTLREESDK